MASMKNSSIHIERDSCTDSAGIEMILFCLKQSLF